MTTISQYKHDNTIFVTSPVGEQVVLPCYSSRPPVLWSYLINIATPSEQFKTVVDDGIAQNGYATRFSLNVTEDGKQDLVIRNASLSDAGLYRCIDDKGIGSHQFVHLSITSECLHAASTLNGLVQMNLYIIILFSELQTVLFLLLVVNNVTVKPDSSFNSFESVFVIHTDPKSEIQIADPATVRISTGASASLPCRASVDADVQWRFGDTQAAVIAANGRVKSGYSNRFSLGDTHEDYHDLILRDSRRSDTGVYKCIENNGIGQEHYVVLIVDGKHSNLLQPMCSEPITLNEPK